MALAANHYVLDGAVDGVVDTVSASGRPVVSLTVNEHTITEAEFRESEAGLELTAALTVSPDKGSTWLVLLLPRVNIDDSPLRFTGVALLVTTRTSLGGPDLVRGVVQHYDVRHAHGTASVVETLADGGTRGYQG